MFNLQQTKHLFLVGIKGVAMAHIATIVGKMGIRVSGYDVEDEFITSEGLLSSHCEIITVLDPDKLPSDTDLVIYSAAHGGSSNPFVQEAEKRGIAIAHQALFLGELLKEFNTTIAVCGCHGKTTTTSLLAHCLIELGQKPSYLVGTSEFSNHRGGDFESKEYFAIEADEYGVDPPRDVSAKFSFLHPTHILCTNIDFDHPDVYKDLDAVKEVYRSFFSDCISRTKDKKPCLYVCGDDLHTKSVIHEIPQNKVVTFGFNEGSDVRVSHYSVSQDSSSFDLTLNGTTISNIIISLWGEKQITNAAGVFSYLITQGFNAENIKAAFRTFTGLKRRFEKIGSVKGVELFDDYAHHPEEIKALIHSAKTRFSGRKIKIIFQPHTYSRTQMLLDQFALSFKDADEVILLPVFSSAREVQPEHDESVAQIALKATEHGVSIKVLGSKKEAISTLLAQIQPQDIVFTVGAGDVYKLGDDIIKGIEKTL